MGAVQLIEGLLKAVLIRYAVGQEIRRKPMPPCRRSSAIGGSASGVPAGGHSTLFLGYVGEASQCG